MSKANDSNSWLFAKATAALLRPGLHPQTEGEEERLGCVVVKISDPLETKGFCIHYQRMSMTNSFFI